MKPFLLNAWYMAAWGAEVREAFLTRRLLEIPIVMYRKGRRHRKNAQSRFRRRLDRVRQDRDSAARTGRIADTVPALSGFEL
jgi:hypothetical protein